MVGGVNGKDFIAAFVALSFFLRAIKLGKTSRVVTTSVKDDHLRVLWGEIARFMQDSRWPLKSDDGGPLLVNHRDIRIAREGKGGISYLRGMVSERGEGLAGHHADWTLGIIDEASGVDDFAYTQMTTWAKRLLVFGNPNACVTGVNHFFFKGIKGGTLLEKKAAVEQESNG